MGFVTFYAQMLSAAWAMGGLDGWLMVSVFGLIPAMGIAGALLAFAELTDWIES